MADNKTILAVIAGMVIMAFFIPLFEGENNFFANAVELQKLYCIIAVSGQDDIICDNSNDTLTFVAGSGMSILTNNVTDALTLISTGGVNNTGQNVGGGAGVFKDNVDEILRFRSLTEGQGINLVENSNDISIATTFLSFSKTCPGTDKISAYNNVTGVYTCSTDLDTDTTGILTINSDAATAQVFSGTTGNVTITDTGAGTLQFNTGYNIVTKTGTLALTNKDLTSSTNTLGSIHALSNVTDTGCASGQILKVSGANWVCAADDDTGGSGEANTASNIGTYGSGVFYQKTGVDLEFKKLLSLDPNLTIGSNTTNVTFDLNNALLTAAITSINSDTTSAQVFSGTAGNVTITDTGAGTLQFNTGYDIVTDTGTQALTNKDLTSSTNTLGSIHALSNVTDTGCASGQILKVSGANWVCAADDNSGSGETNTASNVGTGEASIFKQKSGVDLEFKTLKQARGITLTNNTSDVTIGTSFFADSKTCSGTDKISSFDNATGFYTCTTDSGLTAALTSLNSDTNAAQTIFGTANHISVADTGVGSLTLNTLFKINNATCGSGRFSSFDNVTGNFVCSGGTGAITSINGDTTSAQVFSGTAGNVTITDTGAGTLQFNTGYDIVTETGTQALTNKDLTSTTNTLGPIEKLSNVTDTGCANGQILKVSGGIWSCAADDNSGGITSINADSTAAQVFSGTAGNVTITDTGAGTLQFNTGYDIVTETGTQALTNKDLTSSTNLLGSIHNLSNVTDSGCAVGQILKVSGTTWECAADSTGGGEANTASNTGTGEASIFKQKSGVDLVFKTLKQATGITLTNNTSDVTIGTSFFADSKTCSGTDKLSAYNNATGLYTCSTDLDTDTTGILTINSDAATAQVFSGTAGNVTITDTGAGTLQFNTGYNIVVNNAANTYTGSNAQALGTNFLTFGSDPGDSLDIRLPNTGGLNWEASPTGTDVTLIVDASEDVVFGTGANNINLNSNPVTNGVLGGQLNIAGNTFLNTGTITFPTASTTLAGLAVTETFTAKQTMTPSATTAGLNLGTTSAYPTSPRQGDIDIAGALLQYNDNTNTTQTAIVLSQAQTFTGKKTGTPTASTASFNLGTLASDPTSPRQGDLWISGSALKFNDNTNTTRTALGAAITSLNADTTAAQVIAGTTNQITIGEAGATHTINVGSDIVQIDQANTYSGSNAQALGTNFITFGADPADTGDIRLSNPECIKWESSPAGLDPAICIDLSENFVFTADWSSIDFASNPIISGASIAFDADPADAGDVMLSNTGTIAWEASPAGTDVDLQVDANEDFLFDSDANNINLNSNPITNGVLGGTLNANNNILDNVAQFSSNADEADAGLIRLGNAETIAWEASPAGTDVDIQIDANEDFLFDSDTNNINVNSNPITTGASIAFDADPADAGDVMLSNTGTIAWEASPAGTDVDLQVDANEDFLFDSDARNINLNSNPITGGILGANLDASTFAILFGADPADAGDLRLSNAETLAWEASPAGTDVTLTADASENFVLSSGWNNVDLGSNPMINTVLRAASTGNTVTADPRIAILTAAGGTLQAAATATRTTIDATNLDYIVLDFADGSTQTVIWNWEIPAGFDSTQNVVVDIRYVNDVSTNNIRWQGQFKGVANAETIDAAFEGTAQLITDAAITVGNINTATLTFSSANHALNAGELAIFKLDRLGSDGADTNTGKGRLVDIRISWS